MTKYQKQTIQYSLEEEMKILNTLKRDYKEAGKTIESRIKNLRKREDADLIHVIHQVNYQKALKSQIDDVLDKLNDGTYSSILKYMEDSYGTGFTSSLYRLQKQGVPLIFPMNRDEILRAVQTNSKISKRKYGKNFTKMKNAIRREVTRGISTSMSFGDMARNIDNTMKSGLYNSYRVARTEGHRINQEASFDAMTKAKEAGADVVKKWDSTLDGRTRETHRSLEGQIRELDDPFEVNGKQAMYPSGFGIASEDINCRCVVLEIGRWELDEEDTYSKFDGESGVIVNDLSNIDSYEEFRKKYNIEVKKDDDSLLMSKTIISNIDDYNGLSSYLSSNYNIQLDNSVTSLNFDVVRESLEGIEEVIGEFPELKNSLNVIQTSSIGIMSCTGSKITFNPKYYKNSDVIRSSCIKCSNSGWWVHNASPKSIGVHESAHGVEWLLIELNEADYGNGLSDKSMSDRIDAWNNCKEAQKIVSEACKNIKNTPYGKGKLNKTLKESISMYANKTPSETMAEAFADVSANGNNANPLSLEIKKLTIERYKYYKLKKGVVSP